MLTKIVLSFLNLLFLTFICRPLQSSYMCGIPYVEKLFNYLDSDGDGSIDEVQKGESVKNLKLKLFIEIVDEIFAFFDIDQDDMISTEEIGADEHFDRNGGMLST